MQKSETRPPTQTTHQNKLKMDKRLKYKILYHKSPREEHRQENVNPTQQYFHWYIPEGKGNKGKNTQLGLHQINKLLHGYRKQQHNGNAHDILVKSLISKIYKELTQYHTRKKGIQLKSGQRAWTDTSPRRTYRGLRDTWKNIQYHYPLERCKLKPQWDTI